MCGIAGYFGPIELDPARIRKCLPLMHHRGPDHAAFRHFAQTAIPHTYLLHSRLRILDLDDRANQPFQIGSKSMIFNGELYNYIELRDELAACGHSFKTKSDTEVLLRAIDHWGWACLDRFEGMWALAIHDEADGSVTLCRDRFGEKPLYFLEDESGFYFGSELKFIVSLLGRPLKVNKDHLFRYLVNGYKSLHKKDYSFFDGVKTLAPGGILRLSAEERRTETYWSPAFHPDETMSYDEAVSGAKERLIRSVGLRLRADVPIAFCMSGGVDSNALISIAKNVFDFDVHGFTIVNTDARYEEQDVIEAAVKELKIRHTAIPVDTTDFLARLRTQILQHDAPVYTITYYAQWLLMQKIAEHGYPISVSGTGADELFSGYYDHHLAYLHAVKDDGVLYEKSLRAWTEHVRPYVRNPFLSNPMLFQDNPDFRDHIFLGADSFAKYLKKPWTESFSEDFYTSSLLRNRMLNEMFRENVPQILHEDDLNAMSYSIENRSPFLDRSLFEFANRIPTRHLIQNGYTKAVLRDAVRGIAPAQVLDSYRKVGFNAPVFSFLDVANSSVRSWLLDQSPIFDHVDRKKIETLISKSDLPNSESKFIFYFINAKLFLEEYGQ